ncbi:transporter [Persicirhabdus sediminis]|uniref:Transporter n=1 Tax=Persicirhabdus sediminis TaxID=454144 RepID=A0A8J7MCF3_9BACT|nr:transporter [Persicirhabdus sediminis]MBK1789920.1 transporter [Persicirhabdus sediminis]
MYIAIVSGAFIGAMMVPLCAQSGIQSNQTSGSSDEFSFSRAVESLSPVFDRFYPEEEGTWRFGTGIDFSSGKYGDAEKTEILYLPLNLSYLNGPWNFKLTVPWIRMSGDGSVIGGGEGGVIVGPKGGDTKTEEGLGDIWATAAYSLDSFPSDWGFLDLVGKVKLPTADSDKGLGTGEFDYTLQIDYFKAMGKFSPMVTLAYKVKGSPDEYKLDNVFYTSVGGDYRYSEKINFGASLDFQQASTDTSDDSLEIFSYLGYRLPEDRLLTTYMYFGLSDGSPDFGGGLQIRITL